MTLPTNAQISTLDYAINGQPACYIPASSSANTTTLDYSVNAQPLFTYLNSIITNYIKIYGISIENISKINGISKSNISKVDNTSIN